MAETYPITSCEASLRDLVDDASFNLPSIANYMEWQGFSKESVSRIHISISDSRSRTRVQRQLWEEASETEQSGRGMRIELLIGDAIESWLLERNHKTELRLTYEELGQTATELFSGVLRRKLNDLGRKADNPPQSQELIRYLGLAAVHLNDTLPASLESTAKNQDLPLQAQSDDRLKELVKITVRHKESNAPSE